jgi:hypothetical protein
MILDALVSTGEVLAALCALGVLAMVTRRTRRVAFATMRYAKRYAPRWLAPAMVVCAFIPGPLDELLVIVAALLPILRSHHNRVTFARYIHTAWAR